MKKYKIGYIDEENVWVNTFKRNLRDYFDIVSFNLTSKLTLKNIIQKILDAKFDCLVVDFELKEADIVQFNGNEIVDSLKMIYPYYPVFIITGKEEDEVLDEVEDNDIVRLKDEITHKPEILAQRINNKIENYYKKIESTEKRIEDLINKKNKKGLTPDEEEELTEHYQFLEKINPENKTLKDNLIQHESISKLNEFVEESKEILKTLIEIKEKNQVSDSKEIFSNNKQNPIKSSKIKKVVSFSKKKLATNKVTSINNKAKK